MPRQRNDLHTKQIEAWKRKNSALPADEMHELFIKGILAIRRRSLVTLSNVTVVAVIDRILLECQERFPLLASVSNDSDGLHFEKFCNQMMDSKADDIQDALQELLAEILEVFGKITAEILTKNLHHELMSVTNQPSPVDLEPQAALSLGLARKNRDQK